MDTLSIHSLFLRCPLTLREPHGLSPPPHSSRNHVTDELEGEAGHVQLILFPAPSSHCGELTAVLPILEPCTPSAAGGQVSLSVLGLRVRKSSGLWIEAACDQLPSFHDKGDSGPPYKDSHSVQELVRAQVKGSTIF